MYNFLSTNSTLLFRPHLLASTESERRRARLINVLSSFVILIVILIGIGLIIEALQKPAETGLVRFRSLGSVASMLLLFLVSQFALRQKRFDWAGWIFLIGFILAITIGSITSGYYVRSNELMGLIIVIILAAAVLEYGPFFFS